MGAVPQCPSSNNMKCQLIFLVAFFLPISSLGQTTMPSTPDPTGLTSTDADTTDSQTTTTTTTTTTTESNNNNGGGDGWFVVPGKLNICGTFPFCASCWLNIFLFHIFLFFF